MTAASSSVDYMFTGQEKDENGLYNFRARMYDPSIGIFFGVDPAGQNIAPFSYCGNNPVIRIDKDGKLAWFVIPAIIGTVTGAINVATHWKTIKQDGFWEGLKAFGIGFTAGFVGTLSGTSAFAALGGSATGGGGFMAGALAGGLGYTVNTTVQTVGNAIAYDDPIPTTEEYLNGLFFSMGTAGLLSGLNSVAHGRNFMTGEMPVPTTYQAV